jgi:CDGSH-type Zn-finger protein
MWTKYLQAPTGQTQMSKGGEMHDNSDTVASLDVCQHAENSVTLCPCGKAAKKKYCSDACRQKAYRTSAAFLANKKRWEDARMARRADHYQRRNRSRALSPLHGYSGPVVDGVPRLGDLNLKNYLDGKAPRT